MKLKEFHGCSGVFSVPVSQLPDEAWFIRDKKRNDNDETGALLHVCERDLDPIAHEPTYIVLAGKVRWDSFRGRYECEICKDTWDKNDEEGLKAIWEDGLGTGSEGRA